MSGAENQAGCEEAKWIGEKKGRPFGGDAEPAGVRRGAMNGIQGDLASTSVVCSPQSAGQKVFELLDPIRTAVFGEKIGIICLG